MAPDTAARRERRLRDRLPVRVRHHWRPAAALGVGLAAMVWFLGDVRISPYVTSSSRAEGDPITENVRGSVDLYDTSVPHSIQLTYKQTDFDKMMKEFKKDGTKDYIEADLVVDGVYLNDVGIRLKGNSTLSSLRGNRFGGGMPGGGRNGGGGPAGAGGPADGGTGAQPGAGARPGAGAGAAAGAGAGAAGGAGAGADATAGARPGAGAGATAGAGAGAGAAGGMGGMTQYNLSADKPEELPWLVKVDEYVEGRAYQGEREISLRPGSNAQVPVNEALSLTLTGQSGQKAERYSFTELKVNNRPAATRLLVENPDTDYADEIDDGNSVLYKARAGGSFEYRGDDPTDYETSFKQLNKKGSQDLEPVMKLVKWANKASDKEFAAGLDKYVDVDSLAEYIASQNLLLNFDDMAGPGKNYLLRYDLDTKKFSVLGWDYNLTFSGDATAGPDDSTGMGGFGGGARAGGAGSTGEDKAGAGSGAPQGEPGAMPSGAPQDLPEGGLPEGLPEGLPSGAPQGGMPGGGKGAGGQGGGAGGMSGHVLKTKFLAADSLDGVYKKAYRALYEKFYKSGAATRALDEIADQAKAAGADSKAMRTAVATLRETVTKRASALAEDKEVTG